MKVAVTVDQIQEDIVTLIDLESGMHVFNMPLSLLPDDIRENDILEFCITNNKELRQEQQETVEDLLQDLIQGKHLR